MSKLQQVPLFLIDEETGRVIAKRLLKPQEVAFPCEFQARVDGNTLSALIRLRARERRARVCDMCGGVVCSVCDTCHVCEREDE